MKIVKWMEKLFSLDFSNNYYLICTTSKILFEDFSIYSKFNENKSQFKEGKKEKNYFQQKYESTCFADGPALF